MRLGTRVTITLTIDEKTLAQPVNELDLFYETTLTYEKIKQVAREEKIEIEKTIPLWNNRVFILQALATFRNAL